MNKVERMEKSFRQSLRKPTSYAQEKAEKDRKAARTATRYTFKAAGCGRLDRRAYMPQDGTTVIKTQPHGCPKNGTMGMCYIADLDGRFIGMVDERSLTRV